jgi:DNA-binding MarR family transcriptional regulator
VIKIKNIKLNTLFKLEENFSDGINIHRYHRNSDITYSTVCKLVDRLENNNIFIKKINPENKRAMSITKGKNYDKFAAGIKLLRESLS